MSTLNS